MIFVCGIVIMYYKGNSVGLLGKKGVYDDRLMGAVKGAARIASNPYVQFVTGLAAPEAGAVLGLAKSTGLLKKLSA